MLGRRGVFTRRLSKLVLGIHPYALRLVLYEVETETTWFNSARAYITEKLVFIFFCLYTKSLSVL